MNKLAKTILIGGMMLAFGILGNSPKVEAAVVPTSTSSETTAITLDDYQSGTTVFWGEYFQDVADIVLTKNDIKVADASITLRGDGSYRILVDKKTATDIVTQGDKYQVVAYNRNHTILGRLPLAKTQEGSKIDKISYQSSKGILTGTVPEGTKSLEVSVDGYAFTGEMFDIATDGTFSCTVSNDLYHELKVGSPVLTIVAYNNQHQEIARGALNL
ncbi:hypothetical protein IGI37_000596 [Enterococcus sp. AZ194]|uniref:hypothetical protein n=1 Tax=Enterococcus sp. AZ194 TaxID=2774629 RepID=UPI003F20A67F